MNHNLASTKLRRLSTVTVVAILIAPQPKTTQAQNLNVESATAALQNRYTSIRSLTDLDTGIVWYGQQMTRAATPQKAIATWLHQHGSALGTDQPDLRPTHDSALSNNRQLFAYHQFLDGLPVEYGNARIVVQNFGRENAVVYASGSLTSRPRTGFRPDSVRPGEALRTVRNDPNYAHLTAWTRPRLVIIDATHIRKIGQPVRAWKFTGALPRLDRFEAYTFFVDASTSALVQARNEVYNGLIEGHAAAKATPSTGPDLPNNPPISTPLADLNIIADAVNVFTTNESGTFSIKTLTANPIQLDADLTSPWVTVRNAAGPDLSLSTQATDGDFVEFNFNDVPSEQKTAQINAFIHTVKTHNFYAARAQGFSAIDNSLECNVNASGNCNAYFTTLGPSINFFQSGECVNTAYSSVIAHEYGHYIVDRLQLRQGSFGEGFGDVLSMMIYDDPLVGRDFFGPGTAVRNYSGPDQSYPCFGEVHECGMVLGGVWWKIKDAMRNTLGDREGSDLAQQLFVDWSQITIGIRRGRNSATPLTGIEVLIADDDDNDLTNGTPHSNAICSAFIAHGIPCSGLCETIRRTRATCRAGSFQIRGTVVADLPEGTELTLLLDGANPQQINISRFGRGATNWSSVSTGEHEVCVTDCPNSCRTVTCNP